MKKALGFLLLSVILTTGCTKVDENAKPADPCASGTIKFINNTLSPYKLYINDKFVKEQGKKSVYDHTAFSGSYTVKVEQVSGFIVYPDVREYSIKLAGCKTETVVIPEEQ